MNKRTPFAPTGLALAVVIATAMASQSLWAQDDIPAGDAAMAELNALGTAPQTTQGRLPVLPELFSRALEHDSDLMRQRYELEATQEEVPMARSQLRPQVSAAGQYLWQDSTNIQTSPDDSGLDQPSQRPGEIEETFWQIQLSQPLFSVERWRQLAQADSQVDAAILRVAVAERDLALSVSEAYINAFSAAQRLNLLDAQQESLELQSRQASRAFDLGIGDRINLLEAQSRLDQSISDRVQAENELDNAISQLERLTGLRPDFRPLALGQLSPDNISSVEGSEEQWRGNIVNNLQVQLAQAEREISTTDTRVRRAGYYPELDLNLSYGDRQSDDQLRESEDYRASLDLSMPIYRGGYTTASVRQGEKRVQAAEAVVDNERNLAAQDVRQRLRSLSGGLRRMEALAQAINSSELFLEAAERGEQLGLRDLVDVLDARAQLFDQRIQFVEALSDYALDYLALHSAVGELDTRILQNTMALLGGIIET